MAKYVLEDLLYIREMREQMAKDQMSKARRHVAEMIELVKQRKKELEEYKEWRVKEEERLYEEVMNTEVKKVELDELRSKIANIRNKELDYVQAIDVARDKREEAKKALEEAKLLYKQAQLNREKIEEHKEVWMEEWKREQMRLEDIEMEEFTGAKIDFGL